MATFENIKLDKGLYQSSAGFLGELEKIDPSENYKGTSLENLDAFERQLKRFDIKIKGKDSSPLEKFFQTSDSAVLFPEYVSRTVRQGLEEANEIDSIIASHTDINGLDYRTIYAVPSEEDIAAVSEGEQIPEAEIRTSDNLVKLKKRGNMLVASYEAVRFQHLDIFSVALRSIGTKLAKAQVADAIRVLSSGNDEDDVIGYIECAQNDVLTYKDLLKLWTKIYPYNMNTIVCIPEVAVAIANLPEMRDSRAGLSFHATGKMITPLGANIITNSLLNDQYLFAFDKNYALEMVTAGGIMTDFDKLIDRQLHRAAITQIYGFARIFKDSAKALII